MKITEPKWKLSQLCPVCEQGDALIFLACSKCGKMVLACEEEGTLFPEPNDLNNHASWSCEVRESTHLLCPHCNVINDFRFPKGEEIQAIGFKPEELC